MHERLDAFAFRNLSSGPSIKKKALVSSKSRPPVTSTAGRQVIEEDTVKSLPFNGRNYLDLTKLVPGFTDEPNRGSEINSKVGNGSAFAIIVNGQRVENTSYLIDGMETRNLEGGSGNLLPSIDAI
ncbi:MAG: hypothetical protein L0387_03185 [Acidobacteria bacterium]|nr:hypothetical protein [Acidobacteriota bacterium]